MPRCLVASSFLKEDQLNLWDQSECIPRPSPPLPYQQPALRVALVFFVPFSRNDGCSETSVTRLPQLESNEQVCGHACEEDQSIVVFGLRTVAIYVVTRSKGKYSHATYHKLRDFIYPDRCHLRLKVKVPTNMSENFLISDCSDFQCLQSKSQIFDVKTC